MKRTQEPSEKDEEEQIEKEEQEEIAKIDEELVMEKKDEDQSEFLVPREKYLAAGVHIGTKLKTSHSVKWIYRTTSYGLYVINLVDTDKRIRIAAKFLASFNPEKIAICSMRRYGRQPIRAFAKVTGAKAFDSRFIPGTLTNPMIDQYHECDVLIIIDPHADKQALSEAAKARIPLVALIDTDDYVYNVDLAIPCNNRGRKSLSLVLYLLAREIQRERGLIPPDGDIPLKLEEFESRLSSSVEQ